MVEKIFSMFEESEDDKIRKSIIAILNNYVDDSNTFKAKALAWLEKQGESDETKAIMFLINKGYPIDTNGRFPTFEEMYDIIKEGLEKQDKKEAANSEKACKGEPKFHEGEFIVNHCGTLRHIERVDSTGYQTDGGWLLHNEYEKFFHLWTIADAKDGDVLINKSNDKECPFIFKETKPSNIKTDCLNPLTVLGYCGVGGAGFTKGSGWGDTANCIYYPATKEQRDLLFAKMREAGYRWDAEYKELQKIEQKPTDKAEPKFKIEKGKWYVCIKDLLDSCANKVFCEGDTYLSTHDGSLIPSNSNVPFEVVCPGKYFRDWTIQDAKDGDVLIDKNYMGESPFIFKETKPSNIKTDVPNPLTVLGYCGIGGAGFTKSSGWGDTANCIYYPATQEQRDLLSQKMREVGCEWDAEKKELKKTNPWYTPKYKVGDTIYYSSFGEVKSMVVANVVIDSTDNPMYEDENGSAVFEKDLIEHKPAWSEEDKDMLYKATAIVNRLCAEDKEYIWSVNTLKELFCWLKSFKTRLEEN